MAISRIFPYASIYLKVTISLSFLLPPKVFGWIITAYQKIILWYKNSTYLSYMKFLFSVGLFLLFTYSTQAQKGLKVDYFAGRNFERLVGSKVEPSLDLKWEQNGPLPGMGPSEFSARFKGVISVPVSGMYTFSVKVDDGLRLSIGGVKLFNTWQDNNHVSLRKKLYLEKDRFYSLEAEYYNGILEGELVLFWELPTEAPASLKRNLQGRVPLDWFNQQISLEKIAPQSEALPIPEQQSSIKINKKQPKQVTIDNQVRNAQPASQPLAKKQKVAKQKPPLQPLKAREKQQAITQNRPTTPPLKRKSVPQPAPLPDSLIVLSKRTAAQIGFVKSKAELLPASFPGLDSLAVKLKRYPFIQVEINGHTDYIGDSTNNAKLSLKRAQAVASFLEEKGIEARRLKVQGFGGRFPLSLIDTEAEHNRNRRVEIKLYR